MKRLDMRGVAHDVMLVAFVVVFAIGGVAYLVATNANSCQPVSGAVSSPVSAADCPVSGAVSVTPPSPDAPPPAPAPAPPPKPAPTPAPAPKPEVSKTVFALIEGENMSPVIRSVTLSDNSASKGKHRAMFSNGVISTKFTIPKSKWANTVALTARAYSCKGSPKVSIDIDGARIAEREIKNTRWETYTIRNLDTKGSPQPLYFPAGSHSLTLRFSNDYYGGRGCDRNLFIDKVQLIGP